MIIVHDVQFGMDWSLVAKCSQKSSRAASILSKILHVVIGCSVIHKAHDVCVHVSLLVLAKVNMPPWVDLRQKYIQFMNVRCIVDCWKVWSDIWCYLIYCKICQIGPKWTQNIGNLMWKTSMFFFTIKHTRMVWKMTHILGLTKSVKAQLLLNLLIMRFCFLK